MKFRFLAIAVAIPVLFVSGCSTTSDVVGQAKALTPAQVQAKAHDLTAAAILVDNSKSLRSALSAGVALVQQYATSSAPDPKTLLDAVDAAVTKAVPSQAPLINAAVNTILYGLYQSEYKKLAGHNDLLLADLQALAAGVSAGLAGSSIPVSFEYSLSSSSGYILIDGARGR